MDTFVKALSWVNLRYLFEGFGITIEVSLWAIVLSFIVGSLLGVARYVNVKYFSAIVGFVIDIIRNLPLILILFFVYFGLPGIGIRVAVVPAAIIALSIFESAMLAEIIRSGINAVPKGQMEAARSNGLTYVQAMTQVIMPLAFRKMSPPIVSQFISLIKDTSLATIILLPEAMYRAEIIYGQNVNYMIPMYVALAVIYFVINYLLSIASRYLAKRLAI